MTWHTENPSESGWYIAAVISKVAGGKIVLSCFWCGHEWSTVDVVVAWMPYPPFPDLALQHLIVKE